MNGNNKKYFVLDTNVVLHDFQCIDSFADNNVVIPITLLEEIDHFKKGNEIINFNARQFARELDDLSEEKILSKGVENRNGGTIFVSTDIRYDPAFKDIFWEDTPDHRILSVAYNLAQKKGKDHVIVVSKDINLRMKARSVGLIAKDYETGKIKNIEELYKGRRLIENIPDEIVDHIYEKGAIGLGKIGLDLKPMPNEYFILRNGNKGVLVTYIDKFKTLRHIEKKEAYGIMPRNAEQTFSLDALTNNDIRLVTVSGKAGTGKTLMALAAALQTQKKYKQILLARPIVPLANKDIGFLPGDVDSKIGPYMQPLYDNLGVIKHQFDDNAPEFEAINRMLNSGQLQIMPLAYIRGRTLARSYFIVDEAQNLTPHEVKTIITRAGEGTKIVLTGDPYQIDTPYLDSRSNGLTYLIDKMKGQSIYAHITLEKGERSELAELASDLL